MQDLLEQQKKWDMHYAQAQLGSPARVMLENAHLLPPSGDGLEIACGMGANSVFMANKGLRVHAWDISKVAIERLQSFAFAEKLPIIGQVRDSVQDPPAPQSFDVIAVSHFLDRQLIPHLIGALKPGGLLFYQTFSKLRIDETGPRNEEFRLGDNELLTLCAPLRVVVYREEQTIGDVTKGLRNLVNFVGQKRQ